jgi:hypothetical protein
VRSSGQMRILVGLLSLGLIALMLAEFFVTFLLPRRVKRDPRIARQVFAVIWKPWRAIAARLPTVAGFQELGGFRLGLALPRLLVGISSR